VNSERTKMDERLNLTRLGNPRGDYGLVQQRARSADLVVAGLVTDPKAVLKLYEMAKSNEAFYAQGNVEKIRGFVAGEFERKLIGEELGLGFAIISKEMVNVARWSKAYPHLIINDLYQFESEEPLLREVRKLDTNKEGAFCGWEVAIADFETKQWFEFLRSERENSDKRKYLEARMDGELHK
jgi:hypothetical protein